MPKLKKYLLFTFITAWILGGIGCCMGSLGSVLPLCMFMPALGALLVKADIKEMGWRLRSYKNWKYIVFAWLAPTVFQIIGAALYFMVFPEDFAPAEAFQRFMSDTEYEEFLRNGSHYAAYIADDISDSLNPLSALVPIILALGEEIGWRGFMYPELEESHGRTKGLLIGGAIHGAWHFPGMLLAGFEYGTDYIGAPVLGLVVFCFYTVAMGIISYHLYVKSGSIWLPAIFHAMINSESSPRMLLGNSHPERSVFGPVDIGLIAMLPMAACAAFLLWYQYKREQTEPENDLYADSFSE